MKSQDKSTGEGGWPKRDDLPMVNKEDKVVYFGKSKNTQDECCDNPSNIEEVKLFTSKRFECKICNKIIS